MTKEQLRKTIGANIRRERVSKHMTVEQMAELLDLTPEFIEMIEHGARNATAFNLHRIANALDVSIDKLYEPCAEFSPDQKASAQKLKKFIGQSRRLNDNELDFMIEMIRRLRKIRPGKGK